MRPLSPSPRSLVASGAPAPTPSSLSLSQAYPDGIAHYELIRRINDGRLPYSATRGFDTWEPGAVVEAAVGAVDGRLRTCHSNTSEVTYGFEGDGWYLALCCYDGHWSAHVGATQQSKIEAVLGFVEALAGDFQVGEDDEVPMAVWTESPMGGGYKRWASMKVGDWDEVEGNYPAATRESLASLAAGLPDSSAGGLVLLCGKAGTGKTRAIEALAAAWVEEAEIAVVVDSDRLLSSASYLTDVVISGSGRRQVVIVEDCDGMIVKGPKGDRTSKIINATDGIMGRLAGNGTLFIFTANLMLSEIASYITRPGRCIKAIEFDRFSQEEAVEWLTARGFDGEVEERKAPWTLADLYERLATGGLTST